MTDPRINPEVVGPRKVDRMKRFDNGGQRVTDCCAGFATYGPNVTLANLDTVPLKCAECGRLTTPGEGDGTEYRAGVTAAIWYAYLANS